MAELRALVEIDALQPQWAAYVAQTCQGDPPLAGMAQLYVEVAPANTVFALVDAAVKRADVRSALQVVERQYGTLELHGRDPESVKTACEAVLERLGRSRDQRTRPEVIAQETVTRVSANQAQLVNRLGSASLLLENETTYQVAVVAPAPRVGLETCVSICFDRLIHPGLGLRDQAVTMSDCIGPRTARSSFCSCWGTFSSFRVVTRSSTNALKSSAVMFRPACAAFMSRPV